MMTRVLEDFVGNTPLVRLQRPPGKTSNSILAKLEGNNPSGSVKDRPALSMIQHAEARGEIKPGDTLIEATSGNTCVGDGDVASKGQTVSVRYTGWLENGTKFDFSKGRHEPFKYKLGTGQVIRGWEKGVAGMKVGAVRRLSIPPQLGYGDRGAGGVMPPKATLVFDVELLRISQSAQRQITSVRHE